MGIVTIPATNSVHVVVRSARSSLEVHLALVHLRMLQV